MNIQDFLPWLSIVLTLGAVIGGIAAYKKGFSQEAAAIQERVIDALKEEVGTLRNKVDDLEHERATQDRVIATIRYVLRQYGLKIIISGDVVTLSDRAGNRKAAPVQPPGKTVKPMTPDDDDDDSDAV